MDLCRNQTITVMCVFGSTKLIFVFTIFAAYKDKTFYNLSLFFTNSDSTYFKALCFIWSTTRTLKETPLSSRKKIRLGNERLYDNMMRWNSGTSTQFSSSMIWYTRPVYSMMCEQITCYFIRNLSLIIKCENVHHLCL